MYGFESVSLRSIRNVIPLHDGSEVVTKKTFSITSVYLLNLCSKMSLINPDKRAIV